LLNLIGALRRRDAATDFSVRVSEELALLSTWATTSQQSVIASTAAIGGSPTDEEATRAVYAAKGRATVAFLMLDSPNWPEALNFQGARRGAVGLEGRCRIPSVVASTADPDGSLFGNHPAAMSYRSGVLRRRPRISAPL